MILYAVTRGCPIGVDVEDITAAEWRHGLARRFFARAEVAALEALPPQVQHDAFFRFWTLKEAYIKARGLGLRYRCRARLLTRRRPPANHCLHQAGRRQPQRMAVCRVAAGRPPSGRRGTPVSAADADEPPLGVASTPSLRRGRGGVRTVPAGRTG